MTTTWTPPVIDAVTAETAKLAFEAHELAETADTAGARRLAALVAEDLGRTLAELPVGYPEAIEAGANPGGYVGVYVDIAGRQLRFPIPADPDAATQIISAIWTPAIIARTAWRLVIFDGDDGLCPLSVWTDKYFGDLLDET